MPGKTPSPSSSPGRRSRAASKTPSPSRAKSPKSSPSPRRAGSKTPSSPSRKSPKDKSPSPGRHGSAKGKGSARPGSSKSAKSPGGESTPSSTAKGKKNVSIRTPELTCRGLKVLDYSGQGMTVIPSTLATTKDVGVLILASNNLRGLPQDVRKIRTLIKLDISRNGIRCTHPGDFSGLPQELEQLTDLEELKISECNLPYVPPAVWRIKSLRVLDLSRNKINILPPEVGNLCELRRLNLQQTNITSLPPEIAYCQELEEILLWGNSIETLPDTLPEMPSLRVLALNYRSFCGVVDPYMENLLKKRQINSEHIPVVVFELPALEVLDLESTKLNNLPDVYNIGLREFYLCRNFLQTIPPTIYNLRYLQVLDMSFNLLMNLPEDIGRLQSLKVLRLNNNSFERIPPTIGLLENLVELNIAKNRVRRLPPEIRGLTELKTLIAEHNDLQSLPDEVCELVKLETLDVTNNAIKVLPMRLYKLTNLKEAHGFCKLAKHGLWLYRNPLEQPPPDIWRTERPENIFRYLKKLQIIKTENLQRQKILVLGNSQAGKTSLVRVLAHGKSILTSALTDATRLLEQTPAKTENNVAFMLNDFGGDEAYHMMHHLFLDKKAMAVVVYDASTFKEEDYHHAIGRWLQMLTAYTPGIVVKLVGTKADLLAPEEEEGEDVAVKSQKGSEKGDEDEKEDEKDEEDEEEGKKEKDAAPSHSDLVHQLVKHHMQDYKRQHLGELEAIQDDLNKLDGLELTDQQEAVQQMLNTRKDRINDILECPLRCLPKVSSVSATDSLEGIRELVNDLEHLAIDRSLFPHAQRKVPPHWGRMKQTLKLQRGYYLLWDHVEQTAALFGIKDDELKECVQYLCDTGEVLWYDTFPGLDEIVFHRPRVLVDLLASLYRHDLKDFLLYPDNRVFYSKGRMTKDGFEISRDLLLKYGQISRPMLNCLWFHEKMSQETITDMLELLPLLDLCYTIPENNVPTLPLWERPLMVLPFYNQDQDPTPLAEEWPEATPPGEKTLKVIYHFPVVFPYGIFYHVSAAIQEWVQERMDWRDLIFARTENEKLLVWRNLSGLAGDQAGTLMLAVRGSDLHSMTDLMVDLMEQVMELFKRFPGLYWKVDVQGGSSLDSFLKVM